MSELIPWHVVLNRFRNEPHVGTGVGATIVKSILGPQKVHDVVLHVTTITITLQKVSREHLTLVGILDLQEIGSLFQGGNTSCSDQETPSKKSGVIDDLGNGQLLLLKDFSDRDFDSYIRCFIT